MNYIVGAAADFCSFVFFQELDKYFTYLYWTVLSNKLWLQDTNEKSMQGCSICSFCFRLSFFSETQDRWTLISIK